MTWLQRDCVPKGYWLEDLICEMILLCSSVPDKMSLSYLLYFFPFCPWLCPWLVCVCVWVLCCVCVAIWVFWFICGPWMLYYQIARQKVSTDVIMAWMPGWQSAAPWLDLRPAPQERMHAWYCKTCQKSITIGFRCRTEHSADSGSLLLDQLWVSMWITIYWEKKLL